MKNRLARQVRRVGVTDPVAAARHHDYADAFAIDLPAPDAHPPEAWMRAGLAAVPPVVNGIVRLLGVRPTSDPLGDWQIRASGPEVIHLEQSLPLMDVVFVGRRVGPTRRMLTTAVTYRRPLLGRVVMTIIAPGHRRMARRVIASGIPAPHAHRGADAVAGA